MCSSVEEKKISLCAELCFHAFSPFVQAILDCFHPQYKFLCYDGPGFLKAGNFPLCDGDKGENAWKNPSSVPLAAMDKVISMGRLIRPRLFLLWRVAASCVDAAGTSSMQLHSPTLEDVREEEALIWQEDWGGIFFFVKHERELMPGAQARRSGGVVCPGPDSEEMPHKPRVSAYTRGGWGVGGVLVA